MKTLLRFSALLWAGTLLWGQSPLAPPATEIDYVLKKEDKIWVAKAGAAMELTEEIQLPFEVTVTTNGTFRVKEGKERALQEGQRINADGTLLSANGSIMPVIDHLAVKGGKVILVRDGEAKPLAESMAFPNGTTISPDATMIKPSGMRVWLVDGQLYKMDGTPFPARDTVMLKNGKVMVQKDGALLTLQSTQIMEMSDGTRVYGSGLVKFRDGKQTQLTEGKLITVQGVVR